MSTQNTYMKEYKKNQIETATPEQILILLYDGAIQYLNKAKIAIEQEDNDQAHNSIFACQNIILEFMNTLDMERGGDVAANLYRLYQYFYNTLVSASVSHNIAKIDEVLKHLKSLRETWQKAIEIAKAERDEKLRNGVNQQSTTSFVNGSAQEGYGNADYYDKYVQEDDDDDDDDEEEEDE